MWSALFAIVVVAAAAAAAQMTPIYYLHFFDGQTLNNIKQHSYEINSK